MLVASAAGGCAWSPRPDGEGGSASRRGASTIVEADRALASGDTEAALRILAAAIERNPTLTAAHLKLGEIYRATGDYAEAEQRYAAAARLAPRSFDAQYYHGLTLQLLGRVAESIRAYLRALAISPDDFEANLNLATAYLDLDEPRQALPFAERSSMLDPSSGPAHANLGAVYSALDRHRDAVRHYQAASELMEMTPGLLLSLADSLGRLSRYEEMTNTLDRAIELDPTASAWERLGFARFKTRRYDEASAAFERSLELDAGHFPALNGLGVVLLNDYLRGGRADDGVRREAVRLLRRSLRINPRQGRILELITRYG